MVRAAEEGKATPRMALAPWHCFLAGGGWKSGDRKKKTKQQKQNNKTKLNKNNTKKTHFLDEWQRTKKDVVRRTLTRAQPSHMSAPEARPEGPGASNVRSGSHWQVRDGHSREWVRTRSYRNGVCFRHSLPAGPPRRMGLAPVLYQFYPKKNGSPDPPSLRGVRRGR